MIQNRRSLYTDVNGMELRDDVMPPFDLVANNGDVHDFIAGGVPPHWHSQLEIFLLLEGKVRVGVGEVMRDIKPGFGCFINTGVIHSVTASIRPAAIAHSSLTQEFWPVCRAACLM